MLPNDDTRGGDRELWRLRRDPDQAHGAHGPEHKMSEELQERMQEELQERMLEWMPHRYRIECQERECQMDAR